MLVLRVGRPKPFKHSKRTYLTRRASGRPATFAPGKGVFAVPSLFVIRGNDQGSRFEFTESTVRLGRDVSNPIQIHDTEVSRQHAEIQRVDGDYFLIDLESSNGTYANGQRVTQHRLSSGDQIQLGGTLLLYTGPMGDSEADLSGSVDIGMPELGAEPSRILHSISQEDGSRVFDLEAETSRDPWLARARSNLQIMYRTALAVSH
ncbi:MAG: FHA domain-containing protein, partial [Pirellulales bacterium]|nr:FHA domain-containing protein [Pirellulales bacterium]